MTRRWCILGMVLTAVALGGGALLYADWVYVPRTDKWVHLEPKDVETETSDLQFQRALDSWQRGDNTDARRTLEGWLRFYRHRRDCQSALFLLGEICRADGDYDSACEHYEELLNRYAGTDLFDRVLGVQTEIAEAYLAGRKRRVMNVFWMDAKDEAITLLEKVFRRDPRGVRGKKALRTMADFHYRTGEFASAEDEYQRLVTNFPNDADVAEFKMLAAQAALARFRGIRTDARPLKEAEQRLLQIQQDHPDVASREHVDQVLSGIRERKAEKDYEVGRFYEKTGKTKGAAYYYQSIRRNYPGTVWAQRAQDRLTAMGLADSDPSAPPVVVAAGVDLLPSPTAVAADDDSPQPQQPAASLDGTLSDREDRPPVVLWAGPAPILRNFGWEGVIDIGQPTAGDVWPVNSAEPIQLGDVFGPTPRPDR